ncbi:Rieske 2Fe-2S domain-containing protein [Micromonospora sp. BRA006-A]|nr:Rieske 2Fe-2S domain-containing protein [Micromonospora sp. BRA006-A]
MPARRWSRRPENLNASTRSVGTAARRVNDRIRTGVGMDQEHGSTAAPGHVGSRRRLVQFGCLVVGARTLAACLPQPETDAGATSAPTDPRGGDSSPGTAPLARLSDIPVEGGLVLRDRNIVITRGSAAGIVAFTAVCSHQGCQVTSVVGGLIRCPVTAAGSTRARANRWPGQQRNH